MQSLFPQQGARQQQQPLVQFKAGKCTMIQHGNTYTVNPELQKGQISLTKTADNLISFQWSDRTTNSKDASLILFPDDVDFKKVNTGRENDRVYMLKWRSGGKVLMFWMQQKNSSKDAELCSKVNELINNPAAGAAAHPSTEGVSGAGSDAWMQLLGLGPGGAGGSIAPGATRTDASQSAPPPRNAPQQLLGNLDLSSLLAGIPPQPSAVRRPPTQPAPTSQPASSSAPGTITSEHLHRAMAALGGQAGGFSGQPQFPRLQEILSPDAVIGTGVLNDPQAVEGLVRELPSGQQSAEYLEETIRSPQLRQALSALSEGISGENHSTILTNFGLQSTTASTQQLEQGNPVGAFLSSVEAAVDASRPPPIVQEGAQAQGADSAEEKKDSSGDGPMEG